MSNFWKKLSSELVHQNPYYQYRHDVFETGNGKKGDYYYVATGGSVVIIPVLNDGRLVLIRAYRYLLDRWSAEFPGGALAEGQTFEQAARRELLEETGFEAEEIINVAEFCPWNGITSENCRVFLAHGLRQKTAQNNPLEPIEVLPRRPDEVDEMVKKNEIWDGQTLAAWALVHHHFLHK